jgi:dienelactone hydrolase
MTMKKEMQDASYPSNRRGIHHMKHNTAGMILGMVMAAGMVHGMELPDPLVTGKGDAVTTTTRWRDERRPEILELFRKHVYGRNPVGKPDNLRFETTKTDPNAMDGMATLKRIDIHYAGPGGEGKMELIVFIPNKAARPVPGFLFICNRGLEHMDPARANKSPFWPAERIVERGYVAAVFHNSEVAPDQPKMFHLGVHGIFEEKQSGRAPDAWGTIAAWAWGASRAMDYFETDRDIDAKRIAVVGHSRGGKAALWCGAQDERFALVVSNSSGCTGAALARRKIGERIADINKRFPHWLCANYKKFNGKEDDLPVDQHQLIALMAPRPVYVSSASQDAWADPMGEFLSCVHAGPVYQLHGLKGVGTDDFPKAGQPLHAGHIGYHLRDGKHDLTEYDWDRFMDFAHHHFGVRKADAPNESGK